MSAQELDFAAEVLTTEADAIQSLSERLDKSFTHVVERILSCPGRVVVTGMGKAGLIAQKVSATFASTGTPSIYLHPADAYHGDLGRVTSSDLVLMMSNSGETEELVRLVEPLRGVGCSIFAITSEETSTLGELVDHVIEIGNMEEACPMGLAPSTSTTAMLALGDALCLTTLERRDFSREEYARFHPGGSLGRKLMNVEEIMRTGEHNPIVHEDSTVRDALASITKARAGAINVIGDQNRLTGIFTDGDLRRLSEHSNDQIGQQKIREVMTADPITIHPEQLATEAGRIMKEKKVDELPVVNDDREPVGMLDIQDLLEARLID